MEGKHLIIETDRTYTFASDGIPTASWTQNDTNQSDMNRWTCWFQDVIWYCWWKKSRSSWYWEYPMFHRISNTNEVVSRIFSINSTIRNTWNTQHWWSRRRLFSTVNASGGHRPSTHFPFNLGEAKIGEIWWWDWDLLVMLQFNMSRYFAYVIYIYIYIYIFVRPEHVFVSFHPLP